MTRTTPSSSACIDSSTGSDRVFLIGAMKCGTSSLFRYLSTHPEIHPCAKKEPKFFAHPDPTEQAVTDYLRLFDGRDGQPWLLEGSTWNTMYPTHHAAVRIHQRFPEAKLIYIVRDPVDRVWSHYRHLIWKDREHRPLIEAFRKDEQYRNYSSYHLQVSKYTSIFDVSQLLILVFEDFVRNKIATIRRVAEFLGIDQSFEPPNLKTVYNSAEVEQRLAVSPTLRGIRRIPGYELAPYRVKNWLTRSLGVPMPIKQAEFDNPVREEIRNSVQDDTNQFFELLGRRIDLWKNMV